FASLEDLSGPFSHHLARHLKLSDVQSTSRSSKFLDACRGFNSGSVSAEELKENTVRYGFNNVLDAFHVVGRGDVPTRFFIDERKTRGGIAISDELIQLAKGIEQWNLVPEVEARWRLVETAWHLGLSPRLLQVEFDSGAEHLFIWDSSSRRLDITSARDALNGYQKGKCFYCNDAIAVDSSQPNLCDVDHFFPHRLKSTWSTDSNIDGVWNLVLACKECNRGEGGKFDRIPALRYLEALHTRNDFLIESHHPLRETLMSQTGETVQKRKEFLQRQYDRAKEALVHSWTPSLLKADGL
ncbi:MAG: hypothetical protein KDD66_08635, partial [Bdellovibrionales bacterium]|nr:hypothetical protein [Bdellovibrionales bacterium]